MGRCNYAVTLIMLYMSIGIIATCARFDFRGLSNPSDILFERQQTSKPSHPATPKLHHIKDAHLLASSWWQNTHASSVQSAKDSRDHPFIFFPTRNKGADPTGRSDSTAALQLTINRAFEVASTHFLMKGISDLGGVQVHLGGGQYLISKPLTLPNRGGGNVLIHGGTLRAMSSFPSNRSLMEFNSSHGYENIVLQNLMLDGNYTANGILLLNPLRTTIVNCYIAHFSFFGISVYGGHETFIHNSFLGQHITSGGDPGERNFSGIAILLASNDNAITDVVIFSAQTGIEILGQANILTGIHCYNKATGWGGVGIMIRNGAVQNRMLGCYLDYTGIVLEETRQITITNSFFLGDAYVLLKALGSSSPSSVIGVSIVDNMFYGTYHGVPIVQAEGNFSNVRETVVDGNSAIGMAIRSTRARVSTSGLGSNWTVDLSNTLLFPNSIASVEYSFFASRSSNQNVTNMFPQHALRSVTPNNITVACEIPIYAIVSFFVDQSSYGNNIGNGYLS